MIMINIKTPVTSGLAAALMALFLAGCNGQEDFSDAVIGGDPLGSGVGAGANFNANDACAPRVIGSLEDEGTLRNIRYMCDGFYGYTGVTGLPDEQEQNLFVCPLGARSVTFLLGGRENNLPLGTAYFRSASSRNAETGCVYNSAEEVYDTGQYDADGLYLFTVSDLVISPARIDAVDMTGDGNENKRKVRNVSGLLRALDTQPGDALISVDQVAHDVFIADNSNPSPFNFPVTELIKDYAEFTQSAGIADQYIERVESETAATLAGFPSEGSIPGVLLRSNRATNAGLYRFEMVPNRLADPLLVEEGVLDPQTLYSHQLAFEVAISASAPGSQVADPFLRNELEFMPVAMVTRRGDVTMGGSFSVIDYDNNAPLCEPEGYGYSAFSQRSYELDHEGTFVNWVMDNAFNGGDTLSMRGRLFTGYAFSNETSNTGAISDYSVLYGNLPAGAYQFFDDTDRTEFDGSYCSTTITDQPVFIFSRAGTVVPQLDPEVMQTLAPDGTPLQYTLSYLNRNNADDVDPTNTKASLRITVHRDGAVFTDLYDAGGVETPDGNTGYVPGDAVPANEFQIGMVSSLFRDPLNPLDPSKAVLNLIVYNFAPLIESGSLPMYGSHFRARLVPDIACDGDNRLFPAALDFETDTSLSAVWYDPYAAAQAIKSTDPETDALLRYESLRKQAYGYVEATRTDCP